MFSSPSAKAVAFLVAFSVVSVYAQGIVPVTDYPYILMAPVTPVAGKDSVKLKLALGQAGNSCMAPTFTNSSFTIEQSPLAIYPPTFNVKLSYTQVPVPPGKMCPDIYMPVDYGPSYALGKLALGNYNVTDQNTSKQVGSFSVVNSAPVVTDTVTVTPQKPTTKDSLHFDLFNASLSCCTQYYSKNVSVTDTMITLSYEYLDNFACMCLVAGSHTPFACGPQKAGRYGIYKMEGIYCPPGQICPLGPVMLKRVGSVVVAAQTSAMQGNGHLAMMDRASSMAIIHSSAGVRLKIGLDRAQRVKVFAYSTNGKLLTRVVADTPLSKGVHTLDLTGFPKAGGVMIVRVKGETFTASKIVEITK